MIYYQMKDYLKSVSFNRKALAIREKSLPFDDSAILTCCNHIAIAYELMRDQSNALLFYEKIIDIREKSSSPVDLSLVTIYIETGRTYYSLKDYPKALSVYRKALTIQQRLLPTNHPDLIPTVYYERSAHILEK